MASRSPLSLFLVALSSLAILVATLRPAGDTPPGGWSFYLAGGPEAVAELIQNLLLFMPFGFGLALVWRRRWSLVATGALLSLAVEVIQQWLPGRDPSVGDILCNTIGTALGAALVWTAPRWLAVSPYQAARRSLAVSAAAAAVWLGTGWLVQPALPATLYYDHWTPPDYHDWTPYQGRILSATLGALALQRRPIGGAGDARSLLVAGQPLRIVVEAGPAPRGPAALLVLVDTVQVIGYVAVAGTDLLAVYRTHAAALYLEQPEVIARGALAGVEPGDTITVAVERDPAPGGARLCLSRDDARSCGLGYTMGDGWKFIYYPRSFAPWALATLNALWMAGWTVGVGWWARRHAATGVGLAVVALTISLGPRLVGLNPTPVGEVMGAMAGLAVGWLMQRRGRIYRTRP